MTVLDHERGVPQASGFARLLKCLGWAIFLGISWTWCIGMFLPVLLVRDYGVWGWVVFAIPNVIGAAAVGWLNRTAEQSVQTVKAHGPMMTAFSAVTATFQIFFTLWILGRLSPSPEDFTKATFAFALIVVSLPLSRSFTYGPLVAIFVLLISIGCMVEGFRSDQLIPIHKILDLLRIN
ncbi:MAG TPA: hypothetical protein VHS31_13170, partial [Tepidisphaeraceae bacterium]|nr:hypothetical protein [Tepidisphaeraceae bacterium]